jgi:hypothetical protein
MNSATSAASAMARSIWLRTACRISSIEVTTVSGMELQADYRLKSRAGTRGKASRPGVGPATAQHSSGIIHRLVFSQAAIERISEDKGEVSGVARRHMCGVRPGEETCAAC